MSTKLYDGLMYEGTFLQLSEQMKGVTKQVKEEIAAKVSDVVSAKLCILFDGMNAGIELETLRKMVTPFELNEPIKLKEDEQFFWVAHTLCNAVSKENKATIMFYPLTEDKILAYPFAHSSSVKFEEFDNFKEYGYWNNTDQPEDVTDEEWDQRKEDWDTIGGGRFIDNGFSYLLFDEGSFMFHRNFKFKPFDRAKRVKILKNYCDIEVKESDLVPFPENILDVKVKVKEQGEQ